MNILSQRCNIFNIYQRLKENYDDKLDESESYEIHLAVWLQYEEIIIPQLPPECVTRYLPKVESYAFITYSRNMEEKGCGLDFSFNVLEYYDKIVPYVLEYLYVNEDRFINLLVQHFYFNLKEPLVFKYSLYRGDRFIPFKKSIDLSDKKEIFTDFVVCRKLGTFGFFKMNNFRYDTFNLENKTEICIQ